MYSGGSYSLVFFPPYLPFHASAPSHSQVDLLLHIIIIIQSFTFYTVIAAEFIVERDKSTFHTIGIYLLLDISVLSCLIFISIHDELVTCTSVPGVLGHYYDEVVYTTHAFFSMFSTY